MQTERGINLPLDEVYVSLTAERRVVRESSFRGLLGDEDSEGTDFGRLERKQESPRSVPVELEVAVSQHARLVFLGDPGAGKTTLMRFLALRFALAVQAGESVAVDREGRSYGETKLPILVRVAEFADAFTKDRSLSVRDFLPRCHCGDLGLSESEVKALYESALGTGNALVLLDGLDEVVSASDRAEIGRRIDGFVAGLPQGNRVIVTSRIMGYRESPLSSAFAEHTLQDMSVEQIEKFLNNWCPAHEKHRDPHASEETRQKRATEEAALLLKAVKDNPGVKRLATNPLLLTILALIHRNGSHLPKRRIELYRIASETLLRDWQLGRGTQEKNTVEEYEALELLAPLAYWMHCHEPTGLIEKRDAEQVLTKILMKTRQLKTKQEAAPVVTEFLRRVEKHTGIFVEKAPGRYGFMHLTFEEYFAARYLVDDEETSVVVDRIQHLKHHPRWEESIRLAIAYERPKRAAKLVREAILQPETKYEKWLCRDLLLAGRCVGDCHAVDALRPVIDEIGLKLIPLVYGLDDTPGCCDGLRRIVWAVLPELESEAVVAALVSSCQSKDEDVRLSAAEALGNLGDSSPVVIAALVSLCQDKNVDVRLSAAQVLGILGDERGVAALVFLCQDKNVDVNILLSAAEALGNLGDSSPVVIAALVSLCQDKNVYVRLYAAQALGNLGDERGVAALVFLCQDKDEQIRRYAAEALGNLGKADPSVVSMFVLECKNKAGYGNFRRYAAEALGNLGKADPLVISVLLSLCQDNDLEVRVFAAQALDKLGDERGISVLVALCQDKDIDIRHYAAEALGNLGKADPSVISVLVWLCYQTTMFQYVPGSAAEAFGKLSESNPSVVSALVYLYHNGGTSKVCCQAAEALGKLGKAEGEILEELCQKLERGEGNADQNWYGLSASAEVLRTKEVEVWAQAQEI
jgi:HEAT repeat protein